MTYLSVILTGPKVTLPAVLVVGAASPNPLYDITGPVVVTALFTTSLVTVMRIPVPSCPLLSRVFIGTVNVEV